MSGLLTRNGKVFLRQELKRMFFYMLSGITFVIGFPVAIALIDWTFSGEFNISLVAYEAGIYFSVRTLAFAMPIAGMIFRFAEGYHQMARYVREGLTRKEYMLVGAITFSVTTMVFIGSMLFYAFWTDNPFPARATMIAIVGMWLMYFVAILIVQMYVWLRWKIATPILFFILWLLSMMIGRWVGGWINFEWFDYLEDGIVDVTFGFVDLAQVNLLLLTITTFILGGVACYLMLRTPIKAK